jgi:hypothetical protein
MQALDSFICLVLGFDSDILSLAVQFSTWPPSDEPMSDPSTGASANASKTRSSKQKAAANPTPHKKATGISSGGIKINEPAPKSHASTPPSCPRLNIPIHHSKRYTRHKYVSSLTIF